jgi:hypothetical protein
LFEELDWLFEDEEPEPRLLPAAPELGRWVVPVCCGGACG